MLASSSAGNCTFVGTGNTRILVDAGLSRKETCLRLQAIGEEPERIDAILLTHEHSDHVSGLVSFLKKYRTPVYLTHLTEPTIDWNAGETPRELFQAGASFQVGDISIDSYTVPHDAADPVGFCFRAGGVKIGLVTDLGYIPASISVHVRGADLLILESNHDLEMLKVGPYPWPVKQRVMSRRGHLSNDVVGEFIASGMDPATATLVLGHLSEHNNHPELARITAAQALSRRGLSTRLVVAEPRRQTEVFRY